MLVALPASIAFGVAIYAPFGAAAAARGALSGILGAAAIGIIAPLAGGTDRLISAPCAPAAAVLGSFALELAAHRGAAFGTEQLAVLILLASLFSAALQVLYGAIGGGTLIKYIPYPVVSGYLSGVGIVIILKQLPSLFGLPKEVSLASGLVDPAAWSGTSLAVGVVTIAVVAAAPKITKSVPPTILGLAAGVGAYFAIAIARPELLSTHGNALVIGELPRGGEATLAAIAEPFSGLRGVQLADFATIAMPALTLSVLLSIDTLKTCVLVDAITRSRHRSNREVVGQGLANLASALIGGIPGAGTSGATLVNINSGGRTRASSVIEGVLVLVAFLLLGRFVAWAPLAALSGILIAVAVRMIDRSSFALLRQRSTLLDFAVIASVIVVAVGVGLITASGVGIGLAILLFIREQIHSSVIHRRCSGNEMFSRQRRLPEEMAILEREGGQTLICELEGSLFFGTTDQLMTELAEELGTRKYVIFDLKRVRSLDLTAAHRLKQIEEQIAEHGGRLIFSSLPERTPTGRRLREYLADVGLLSAESRVSIFDDLSDAIEWTEDQILGARANRDAAKEQTLALREIDVLKGRSEDAIRELESCVAERHVRAGERVFSRGDAGDEVFFIRRGRVRIQLELPNGRNLHVVTFGHGDFFGDLAFLDQGERSADAVATTDTELYVLSRARFDALAAEDPGLGRGFLASMARSLALRLRRADREILALEED